METAVANQLEEKIKGAGSIHTAHGMLVQEVKSTCSLPMLKDMSLADRSKERSIHLSISSGLPESFVTKRKSSVIKMAKISGIENQTAFTLSNTQNLVCKFLHSLCQSQQILPSYSGFILVDNDPTKSLTKIVHYPVIQKPITDSSTVQEAFAIFRRSF